MIYDQSPPAIKARILLNQSRAYDDGHSDDRLDPHPLFFLSQINRTIEGLLSDDSSCKSISLIKRQLKIAKAFSLYYRPPFRSTHSKDPLDQVNNIAKVRVQHLFSGAIILGDLVLVKKLLLNDDNDDLLPIPVAEILNVKSPYFGYPLQLAAAWGHIELVDYFLVHGGANPQIVEIWGLETEGPQLCGNEPW